MKYVITGSLGHIGKPLTEKLRAAGHEVTVISSNPERAKEIEALGAKAAIGLLDDYAFLTTAFTGSDAVFTMVPPKLDAPDWKEYIHQVGIIYKDAILEAGVKKVVNLSSIGANLPEGCGPVSGLCSVENELNKLQQTDVLHLRPGYFYYNFLGNIGMIKQAGIIGSNFGGVTMVLSHPEDIAAVAAEAMLSLGSAGGGAPTAAGDPTGAFTGKTVRYIASDERTTDEIARVLGAAIGKPDLQWVAFSDEDTLDGLLKAGFSEDVAANYVEMGTSLGNGSMTADYNKNKPAFGPTKLEDFAKEFGAAYNA